jgi:hypothetical protein
MSGKDSVPFVPIANSPGHPHLVAHAKLIDFGGASVRRQTFRRGRDASRAAGRNHKRQKATDGHAQRIP